MKLGIDISKWQGDINLEQAKREGVQFAILKAGGGDAGLYKDGKFERNLEECARLGLPVGAYYFGKAMTTNEALKEAEHFERILNGRQFPLLIWYDVEAKMLKAPNLSTIVITFIERMRAGGYNCGIYASESTMKALCKTAAIDNYPHWVARWTKTQPSVRTDIWQFGGETNLLRSNKIAGRTVDQNYLINESLGKVKPAEKPTEKTEQKEEEFTMPKTIKKGSRGKAVKVWQTILGIEADGIFGPITHEKSMKLQKKHGLVQDGIVGPKTWAAGLAEL